MRLRRRDRPTIAETALEAPAALPVAPAWVELERQIQELQARLALMHKDMDTTAPDPKLEQVLELLQAAPTIKPAGTGSEWVFDVKRGTYNEILNVYARRVPIGGARPN